MCLSLRTSSPQITGTACAQPQNVTRPRVQHHDGLLHSCRLLLAHLPPACCLLPDMAQPPGGSCSQIGSWVHQAPCTWPACRPVDWRATIWLLCEEFSPRQPNDNFCTVQQLLHTTLAPETLAMPTEPAKACTLTPHSNAQGAQHGAARTGIWQGASMPDISRAPGL
jgi:hypothetical protein